MLFNSQTFLFFLPTVFLVYWFILGKKLRSQNTFILISSYFFYGWWDFRFLSLIFLSTVTDYLVGLKLYSQSNYKKRKFLLIVSLGFNLGLLGLFKYFNFFIESWISMVNLLGYNLENTYSLNLILPVGISFYTFQTMSYTLDIYTKKLEPTKDFITFATFVSFFPQLVAGPIERASSLLPQIRNKRKFSYENGKLGLKLILWGLYKKIVIADMLAPRVDEIFDNYQNLSGSTLLLGAIYFSIQIYCDFSGYSDIAIGTAKLFGINLNLNFNYPYYSRNISEFWRKWHISLSTWFRDYLYIPLGGSRKGIFISWKNIFLVFLVSGFWHGANWTFIIWGLYHAMFYMISFINKTNRKYLDNLKYNFFPSFKESYLIVKTFLIVTLGWVFFRSEDISSAFGYLQKIFFEFHSKPVFLSGILICIELFFIEFLFRMLNNNYNLFKYYKNLKYLFYYYLTFRVISNSGSNESFIYFNF